MIGDLNDTTPCVYCDRKAFMRIGPRGTPGEPRCLRHLFGPGALSADARRQAEASRKRRTAT